MVLDKDSGAVYVMGREAVRIREDKLLKAFAWPVATAGCFDDLVASESWW